jgi:hypothetical protein
MNNNVSLPKHVYGFLRTEFCNNLEAGSEGLIPAVIFGAESVPGRALSFHVLREDGALVSQVPIHGLCHRKDAPKRELSDLLRWDCFGWWMTVAEFAYLREVTFETRIGEETVRGQYVCTFDFIGDGFSDEPSQHKCFHLIALEEGNYALRTNDECKVLEKSFVMSPFEWAALPQIRRNRLKWWAEE